VHPGATVSVGGVRAAQTFVEQEQGPIVVVKVFTSVPVVVNTEMVTGVGGPMVIAPPGPKVPGTAPSGWEGVALTLTLPEAFVAPD